MYMYIDTPMYIHIFVNVNIYTVSGQSRQCGRMSHEHVLMQMQNYGRQCVCVYVCTVDVAAFRIGKTLWAARV